MTTTKKILFIDDDKTLRDTLTEQFAVHMEFASDTAESLPGNLIPNTIKSPKSGCQTAAEVKIFQ